jgi:hypothetical protein
MPGATPVCCATAARAPRIVNPAQTVVVIVGEGAEWIWNRATMFVRRCEILDFWHALEHAWVFAHLRYGEGSAQADGWVHAIAEDLRTGKVQEVIARLRRLRPKTPELRQSLQGLIHYYSENAGRMLYDQYLRLGYGIGSGAVASAICRSSMLASAKPECVAVRPVPAAS